jgi:hypothetical protein
VALIADVPDTATGIVGHEHAAVLADGDTDRAAPHGVIVDHKSREEILIVSVGVAVM